MSVLHLIGHNHLEGHIPSEIGHLINLTDMDLRSNKIIGMIPTEIGSLLILTGLLLMNNELTGQIPTEIGSLTSLEFLDLNDNKLSSEIPSELGLLSSLQFLRIENNELHGTIPTEIGLLSNLRSIRLENNYLTGTIPSEIGLLTSLKYLSLLNNELTGVIPFELGELTSLTTLEILAGNDFNDTFSEKVEGVSYPDACDWIEMEWTCPKFLLSLDNGCEGPVQVATFRFEGWGCEQSSNFQERNKFSCDDFYGGPYTTPGAKHYITVVPKEGNEFYFAGSVAVGELYTLNADRKREKLSAVITINVFDSRGVNLLQTVEVTLSCSTEQFRFLFDRFGAQELTEWVETSGRHVAPASSYFEPVSPVRLKSSFTSFRLLELSVLSNIRDVAFVPQIEGVVLRPGETLEVDWFENFTYPHLVDCYRSTDRFFFTLIGEPLNSPWDDNPRDESLCSPTIFEECQLLG
mmetsp:Transcript_3144/g.7563  ORF Transcript_3144/g.7563 Transcript_3144/m.7563 type:complete len:464 (+) Transcript_3144:395-1786(+)